MHTAIDIGICVVSVGIGFYAIGNVVKTYYTLADGAIFTKREYNRLIRRMVIDSFVGCGAMQFASAYAVAKYWR